jgi:hypothetical protein
MIDPPENAGVLDRNTHPQIRRPPQVLCQAPQPERSFGQHLIGVLGSSGDHIEDILHEG